ncbi:MAG: hypothetical protein KGZ89_02660 [Actinobacteria bacterium]|nr:hypothetical protein [Actinomycetota bacterium]
MSDKDFFFDEDETQDQAPAKSGGAKPASKRKAAASVETDLVESDPAPSSSVSFSMQSVSMTVAALIGVVALLTGVIIGMFIPGGPTATTGASGTVMPGGAPSAPAPQLTPEQLEGGALPPGHPPLDGMGATPTTPAPGASGQATPPAE